ncbi:MAG: hypothetical protein Q4P07_00410 [Ornithinimicrobium sp.]|uniref:hypothetical protein n=1 Tax=Ornithinimicrobium sp. TaxID=1977084 RepID=UPI0026E06579|nr:hypothetical protein [Ornithinimicrobium sp.]MDO5738591.1 hypothetical protein [Ornithinimicrobium sp.]
MTQNIPNATSERFIGAYDTGGQLAQDDLFGIHRCVPLLEMWGCQSGRAPAHPSWDGYRADPRAPEAGHRTRFRGAIGTAVWAHQVRDNSVETQGHRMIETALDT